MFIRDLRWFLYVGTFVGSLIASVSTGDPRIWVLGIIVLLIAIASSRILLVVFDGRLSVPEPWVIDGEEGDHWYKVRMSEHIFGTDPFYIHSGDALVATLYKGADIAIPLPDDGTVCIGRSEELGQMRTELHLDRDRINYIWCKGDQSAIYNDVFEQGSEIDDRRCAAEYESARSQQLMNARNTALEMAFLVVFFMGLYYMAGRYEPGHGNIRTGGSRLASQSILFQTCESSGTEILILRP